ncbi:hypothetical protein LDENG_00263030 [Lucifuga dentata]|nr:hypothetical protein LDENG_00263030 [Lucifuga dentata]
MSGLRRHFVVGLLLLMCTLTGHCCESAPTAAPAVSERDAQSLRRMADVVKHVEESRSRSSVATAAPVTPPVKATPAERKDFRDLKSDRGDQVIVIFPRDLRKKEKFLKHITGKTLASLSSVLQSQVQEARVQTLPPHQRLHNTCILQKMCEASHTASWQPTVHGGVAHTRLKPKLSYPEGKSWEKVPWTVNREA